MKTTEKTLQEERKVFDEELLKNISQLEIYAKSLTHNVEDAQDLVQDTLMKAMLYKDQFDEKTSINAWTFIIMKNTFINNYNRSVRTRKIMDKSKDLSECNVTIKNNYFNPESLVYTEEIQQKVDLLESDQRVAFEMYNEGFKYKEIAEKLDISIGTVKSRIFFGRQKLIEGLKNDFQYN